jgi:hypothetical protein
VTFDERVRAEYEGAPRGIPPEIREFVVKDRLCKDFVRVEPMQDGLAQVYMCYRFYRALSLEQLRGRFSEAELARWI